jgi:hypothetical protein
MGKAMSDIIRPKAVSASYMTATGKSFIMRPDFPTCN